MTVKVVFTPQGERLSTPVGLCSPKEVLHLIRGHLEMINTTGVDTGLSMQRSECGEREFEAIQYHKGTDIVSGSFGYYTQIEVDNEE